MTTQAKKNGKAPEQVTPQIVVFVVDGNPQIQLGDVDPNAVPTLLRRAAVAVEQRLGIGA